MNKPPNFLILDRLMLDEAMERTDLRTTTQLANASGLFRDEVHLLRGGFVGSIEQRKALANALGLDHRNLWRSVSRDFFKTF